MDLLRYVLRSWVGLEIRIITEQRLLSGGSYAGARAAHMRILYPDIVYGAIASSGK
jgi:hypothetical protein